MCRENLVVLELLEKHMTYCNMAAITTWWLLQHGGDCNMVVIATW